MINDLVPPPRDRTQRAKLTFRVGKRTRLSARVEVTSEGLLAIGGLVSSILLSTAVLVRVAVREGKRPPADSLAAIQR